MQWLRWVSRVSCPLEHCVPSARLVLFTSTSCGAISTFSEPPTSPRLQPTRHRLICLLAALLAPAPLALVLADARPPALLACAPPALVRADARPSALLAWHLFVRRAARLLQCLPPPRRSSHRCRLPAPAYQAPPRCAFFPTTNRQCGFSLRV